MKILYNPCDGACGSPDRKLLPHRIIKTHNFRQHFIDQKPGGIPPVAVGKIFTADDLHAHGFYKIITHGKNIYFDYCIGVFTGPFRAAG